MNLEMFVTWIVVGFLTGGLIGFVMKDGSHGAIWDAILGLAGSGAASTILLASGWFSDASNGAMAIAAFAGAALIIALQRTFWPRPRARKRTWNGEEILK
jgi:uncharacterized membrane protein YeaQ/YmgE (transglycosylase-associated protein family)